MSNRCGPLSVSFLAVCFTAAAFLAEKSGPQTPEQRAASVLQERVRIDAHCEKWDLAQAENRKYDSHSGARREGCRTAFLVHSPYPENQSNAAKWLAAAVAGKTETAYYAQRKMQELHGLNLN
jgi:hypothetical protein